LFCKDTQLGQAGIIPSLMCDAKVGIGQIRMFLGVSDSLKKSLAVTLFLTFVQYMYNPTFILPSPFVEAHRGPSSCVFIAHSLS
jgi:hypothetical protein